MPNSSDGNVHPIISHAQRINSYRAVRARNAAYQICRTALPFSLIFAAIDAFENTGLVFADLLISLGCWISLAWSATIGDKNKFVVWPAYAGLWLSSFPAIYQTGGSGSPFLGDYMALLLVSGVVIQSRVDINRIFIFVAANIALWIAISAWLSLPLPITVQTPFLTCVKNISFLTSIFICVYAFVRTEKGLAQEIFSRSSELSEAKANLAHALKMGEVGNLVATTTHELAQPLQLISNLSFLFRQSLTGDGSKEAVEKFITRIDDAAERMQSLVSRLRGFSRKEFGEARPFNLADAILNVQNLLEFDLRSKGVRLEVKLGPDPLWINGHPLHIQQVLFNLINNARDACIKKANPRIRLETTLSADRIRIFIANNGSPIPLESQTLLFDLYYTTKAEGQGTGLGLSICEELVQAHGGKIYFSSDETETVFVIELPPIAAVGKKLHSPPNYFITGIQK